MTDTERLKSALPTSRLVQKRHAMQVVVIDSRYQDSMGLHYTGQGNDTKNPIRDQ